jgi:DNA-directed RNA polymerase subunit M/transcription elongation factor TFIIS
MAEFIVECPKCKQAAFATRDNAYANYNGRLTCTSCSHVEHIDNLIRYRILVKKHCNNCGSAIDSIIPELKVKKSKINFACPTCGALEEFQPRNEQYRIQYESTGSANDPIFNLPLWLQIEVKGKLFWAYNR